jgi:PTH2 family peptidyl-tRNA hydrolase
MAEREIKQVLIIRKDLKTRRGKEIAQGAHSAMLFMLEAIKSHAGKKIKPEDMFTEEQWLWMNRPMTKITLQVDDEEQLMDVMKRAKKAGLTAWLVTDAGKTEFHGEPTRTALAIGPNYADEIDKVTGDLKLY